MVIIVLIKRGYWWAPCEGGYYEVGVKWEVNTDFKSTQSPLYWLRPVILQWLLTEKEGGTF